MWIFTDSYWNCIEFAFKKSMFWHRDLRKVKHTFIRGSTAVSDDTDFDRAQFIYLLQTAGKGGRLENPAKLHHMSQIQHKDVCQQSKSRTEQILFWQSVPKTSKRNIPLTDCCGFAKYQVQWPGVGRPTWAMRSFDSSYIVLSDSIIFFGLFGAAETWAWSLASFGNRLVMSALDFRRVYNEKFPSVLAHRNIFGCISVNFEFSWKYFFGLALGCSKQNQFHFFFFHQTNVYLSALGIFSRVAGMKWKCWCVIFLSTTL